MLTLIGHSSCAAARRLALVDIVAQESQSAIILLKPIHLLLQLLYLRGAAVARALRGCRRGTAREPVRHPAGDATSLELIHETPSAIVCISANTKKILHSTPAPSLLGIWYVNEGVFQVIVHATDGPVLVRGHRAGNLLVHERVIQARLPVRHEGKVPTSVRSANHLGALPALVVGEHAALLRGVEYVAADRFAGGARDDAGLLRAELEHVIEEGKEDAWEVGCIRKHECGVSA